MAVNTTVPRVNRVRLFEFLAGESNNMAAVSPNLKDLPKVSDDLKTQLEAFDHEKMKHADTQEKIVLPTAAGKRQLFMCSIFMAAC